MEFTESQLAEAVSQSKIGKYDIVKLALAWIEVKKHDDDYRRLTQAELITKAIGDVVGGEATFELVDELRKKRRAKEAKQEEAAAKA